MDVLRVKSDRKFPCLFGHATPERAGARPYQTQLRIACILWRAAQERVPTRFEDDATKPLDNSLFVYREVVQMLAALTLNPSEIRSLSAEFESASPTEVLQWAFDHFGTQAAIGTSFQGAGLVTIHKALAAGIPVPVFTIDTGLLFQETLELKARLERFFGIVIEPLVPELSVQQQAQADRS